MQEELFSILASFENILLLIPVGCCVVKQPGYSIRSGRAISISPVPFYLKQWYLYLLRCQLLRSGPCSFTTFIGEEVIRHEAPNQHFDMTFPTLFYYQVDKGTIIVVAEKCLLPAVAALGYLGGCQVLLLVRILP